MFEIVWKKEDDSEILGMTTVVMGRMKVKERVKENSKKKVKVVKQ